MKSETKESIMYHKYYSSKNAPNLDKEIPGKYKNWYIQSKNKQGKNIVFVITNHSYKINSDKNWLFSSKRLSNKQFFVMELMENSFKIIGDDIKDKFISDVLTAEEMECLKVEISYKGGNLKSEFYSDLLKKEWFNINDISAINYLTFDSYNFYIDIFAFNYKINNLAEEKRQNIYNSLTIIEDRLLKVYDEKASFRIYFNDQYKVEYEDGIKYN